MKKSIKELQLKKLSITELNKKQLLKIVGGGNITDTKRTSSDICSTAP